jgi:hypothetical protein
VASLRAERVEDPPAIELTGLRPRIVTAEVA